MTPVLIARDTHCPHSNAKPGKPCDCGDTWSCGVEMACTSGDDAPYRGFWRELLDYLLARGPYLKR